ncbi:MAG TPA: FAD-dependent oxidoreductase [Allosphingosinicella sp.]|jgi:glycine/D-amino acid oxidase-like deaminating enzyme/nitrite reductase/ring-hydroxylating ferredoxin subunit
MTDLHDKGYWNATAGEPPVFPSLEGDLEVDIAIVGGGIVGVTTARLLKDEGHKVALVEARRVGREVTGKSTAKITSQHGIRYQILEKKFGADHAQAYGEAQQAGLARIRALAAEHGIDAGIEEKPAFLYTRDEAYAGQIEKEAEAARRFGLPATLTTDTGLPFDVRAALRFDRQAQFHPTRYVAGLARTIPGDGCHLFEQSRAVDYEPDRVTTDRGTVRARHVVMATHLPLGQIGLFYAENAPMAEPVVAARIDRDLPGMYKNVEQPSHSIRTHKDADGQLWAICAGTHFKPGHEAEERRWMDDIARWTTDNFGAARPEFHWVNEDYKPMDGAPFIGWSSSRDGYLVATGFDAWGITNGTAAAMIIADLLAGRDNRWAATFDATRVKPIAGGPQFAKANAEVAMELAVGWLSKKANSYDELGRGEAAILKVDGERVAAFRDEDGNIHAVSAVCTHMGCIVGWNATDRTWDCPCHGSRFELSGAVIHGPATRPLGAKIAG